MIIEQDLGGCHTMFKDMMPLIERVAPEYLAGLRIESWARGRNEQVIESELEMKNKLRNEFFLNQNFMKGNGSKAIRDYFKELDKSVEFENILEKLFSNAKQEHPAVLADVLSEVKQRGLLGLYYLGLDFIQKRSLILATPSELGFLGNISFAPGEESLCTAFDFPNFGKLHLPKSLRKEIRDCNFVGLVLDTSNNFYNTPKNEPYVHTFEKGEGIIANEELITATLRYMFLRKCNLNLGTQVDFDNNIRVLGNYKKGV